MIPFRDNIRSRTYPLITLIIIASNVLVFIWELTLTAPQLSGFIEMNALVPSSIQQGGGQPLLTGVIATRHAVTSMFLHAGWIHLLGNMLYLWVFGDNIEDLMGHSRFLLFYMLCGLAAAAAHVLLNPGSTVPAIGASGAVAGVLGAYLVRYPFARILTVIPFIFIWPIIELPAILVLGVWFLMQLLNGSAALVTQNQPVAGIAWWAHVGGFAAGILMVGIFTRGAARPHYRWEELS